MGFIKTATVAMVVSLELVSASAFAQRDGAFEQEQQKRRALQAQWAAKEASDKPPLFPTTTPSAVPSPAPNPADCPNCERVTGLSDDPSCKRYVASIPFDDLKEERFNLSMGVKFHWVDDKCRWLVNWFASFFGKQDWTGRNELQQDQQNRRNKIACLDDVIAKGSNLNVGVTKSPAISNEQGSPIRSEPLPPSAVGAPQQLGPSAPSSGEGLY